MAEPSKTKPHFDKNDGPLIQRDGLKMVKKRNPVYLREQSSDFDVETNEEVLTGKAGDYLAYDPISGHVWPVTASYIAQHYELWPDEPLNEGVVTTSPPVKAS